MPCPKLYSSAVSAPITPTPGPKMNPKMAAEIGANKYTQVHQQCIY